MTLFAAFGRGSGRVAGAFANAWLFGLLVQWFFCWLCQYCRVTSSFGCWIYALKRVFLRRYRKQPYRCYFLIRICPRAFLGAKSFKARGVRPLPTNFFIKFGLFENGVQAEAAALCGPGGMRNGLRLLKFIPLLIIIFQFEKATMLAPRFWILKLRIRIFSRVHPPIQLLQYAFLPLSITLLWPLWIWTLWVSGLVVWYSIVQEATAHSVSRLLQDLHMRFLQAQFLFDVNVFKLLLSHYKLLGRVLLIEQFLHLLHSFDHVLWR